MKNDLKNVFSVEDIILKDDELIQIKGGQQDGVDCGYGCGVGCGSNCGENCAGCSQTPPPITKPGDILC